MTDIQQKGTGSPIAAVFNQLQEAESKAFQSKIKEQAKVVMDALNVANKEKDKLFAMVAEHEESKAAASLLIKDLIRE